MRALLLFAFGLVAVSPLAAQEPDYLTVRPDPSSPQGENMETPPHWVVRPDTPDSDLVVGSEGETADIFFVNMTPGWHVTSGPAAVYYHPASLARGKYTARTKIHLFDPAGGNEAFGLFVGGRDLDGEDISYDYFLIRNSGEFLIKRRIGSETTILVPWTAHGAVRGFGPDSGSSVANTLEVQAGSDDDVFKINGEEAARLPRDEVRTDGIVGLRINHALNVHVEDLAVEL